MNNEPHAVGVRFKRGGRAAPPPFQGGQAAHSAAFCLEKPLFSKKFKNFLKKLQNLVDFVNLI